MPSVKISGALREVPDGLSVRSLLEFAGIAPRLVVVELNGAVVYQENWDDTPVKDGDELEVASFVGGG